MHKLNTVRAFLLATIVLTTGLLAFGQETTGSIEGSVRDATGALVPSITLTITTAKETSTTATTGAGAGFKRTVTTDDEGSFRVLQVPPGTYDVVTTESSGFGEAR